MSQTNLEQSLSALMDGEASELELQRVLRESSTPELRQQWQRMHVARWSMQQEEAVSEVDLSERISLALDDVTMDAAPDQAKKLASLWSRFGKVAVAASVTLAVLAGARFYNSADIAGQEPVMAKVEQTVPLTAQPTVNPVVLASYEGVAQELEKNQAVDENTAWYRERLPAYLRQHNQQSTVSGMETSLPYARAASIERR